MLKSIQPFLQDYTDITVCLGGKTHFPPCYDHS